MDRPTQLFLIRHGESTDTQARRYSGFSDPPLTEKGREQTEQVGKRLRDVPLSAVYTSDLKRSGCTAQVIASPHGLTPIPMADLREQHFGIWEGRTYEEIVSADREAWEAWMADVWTRCPPDGEAATEMSRRGLDALRGIVAQHRGETIAVVGHAGPIWATVIEVLRMDRDACWNVRIDLASITELACYENRWMVMGLNDRCHLKCPSFSLPSVT